jgi:hypothetical protein
MPTLDLWFHAEAGMFHYVSPFLSKLSWNGGLVGLRLRLEPASDIDGLKQLAWTFATARAPVKDMGADSLAWPIDILTSGCVNQSNWDKSGRTGSMRTTIQWTIQAPTPGRNYPSTPIRWTES